MHSRIKKWDRWLADLIAEQMLITNQAFLNLNMLGEIYNRNLALSRAEPFFSLAYNAIMMMVIVNLSALWDPQSKNRKKRVQTLRALLEEMESYSQLLSKKRLLGKKPTVPRTDEPFIITAASNYETHRRILNKLVGSKRKHLEKSEISKDIRKISKAMKCVEFLRNKYISHIDYRRRSRKKVRANLHRALFSINSVFEKYFVIMKGHPGSGVIPRTFQPLNLQFASLFDQNPAPILRTAWDQAINRISPKKLKWALR